MCLNKIIYIFDYIKIFDKNVITELTGRAVVVIVVKTGFFCQSRYDEVHQYRPKKTIEKTTELQIILPNLVW